MESRRCQIEWSTFFISVFCFTETPLDKIVPLIEHSEDVFAILKIIQINERRDKARLPEVFDLYIELIGTEIIQKSNWIYVSLAFPVGSTKNDNNCSYNRNRSAPSRYFQNPI